MLLRLRYPLFLPSCPCLSSPFLTSHLQPTNHEPNVCSFSRVKYYFHCLNYCIKIAKKPPNTKVISCIRDTSIIYTLEKYIVSVMNSLLLMSMYSWYSKIVPLNFFPVQKRASIYFAYTLVKSVTDSRQTDELT
jgi:hypothetical protein